MRLFYQNAIDAPSVAISASSEVSTLPAANVAHEFRKKMWRTGASVATEYVLFDFGSARTASAIILLDHTLTAGDSNIKVEANTIASFISPAFSQSLTWASGTIGAVFAQQNYRYWRLVFTKSAAGESRDIGRIFLGDYYQTTEQPDFDGYDSQLFDLARKQKSLGGQVYTEEIDRGYNLMCKFSRANNTMAEMIRTIGEYVGESKSLFVQVDTVSPLDKFWYVKLSRGLKRKVAGFDSALYWDFNLEFEEQL